MSGVNKQLLERWAAFGKAMQKAGSELPRHLIAETEQAIAAAEQAQRPCQYCNGTGDVHSISGVWRGACSCKSWQAQQAEPVAQVKIGNHAPLELGSYMRVEWTPSGALKVTCTREHAPSADVENAEQSNRITDEQLAADGYLNATASALKGGA